jgi:hypothetical protein
MIEGNNVGTPLAVQKPEESSHPEPHEFATQNKDKQEVEKEITETIETTVQSLPTTIPLQPGIVKLLRLAPVLLLEEYLNIHLSDAKKLLSTGLEGRARVRELVERVGGLDDSLLGGIAADADRILEMTDDLGQEALYATAVEQENFASQENAEGRALWLFLRENGAFCRAEEIRYTDNYRMGRMWDGFVGPKDATVSDNIDHLQIFEKRIRTWFRTAQVKVEIFERSRPNLEEDDSHLVQVVVYREGLPESYLEFADGDVDRRNRRPVYEFALTYEPITGAIEVIAQDRLSREKIAQSFSEILLQQEIKSDRIPLRQYNLMPLMNPMEFVTDPEDTIRSVEVTMLTIKPTDGGERVTFDADQKSDKTIYERIFQWFEEHNPLTGGFYLHRAQISVHFLSEKGFGRGKVVHVKLALPNGCNLKSKTEQERLICEKYLPRWGLVKEV